MIEVQKLKNGYEIFGNGFAGWWLQNPSGETKWFPWFEHLEKYCKEIGVEV